MKKYLIILLAAVGLVFSSNAWANLPNDPTFAEAFRQQGTKQNNPYRVVRLVRFSTQSANAIVNSGDAVVWDTVSADGVTVRLTTTSGDNAFAGIAAATISSPDTANSATALDDIGHRNWGWITISGLADANTSAGGTNGNSNGDFFVTSSDSGKITTVKLSATTTATESQVKALMGVGGIFLQAADGTSTKYKVYVKNS